MIQAILFNVSHFVLEKAKKFMRDDKLHYISYRTTDKYYRFRLENPNYKVFNYRIERNFKNNRWIDYIIGYKK